VNDAFNGGAEEQVAALGDRLDPLENGGAKARQLGVDERDAGVLAS
jgi:hypothetical protein